MQIDDSNVSKIYFHQLGPSFLATALHVSTLGELGRAFSATGSQSNEPGTSPMKKGTRVEGGSWVRGGEPNPGGGGVRVRSEVNSELNFPPNFEGLVLGCIDADFCK